MTDFSMAACMLFTLCVVRSFAQTQSITTTCVSRVCHSQCAYLIYIVHNSLPYLLGITNPDQDSSLDRSGIYLLIEHVALYRQLQL